MKKQEDVLVKEKLDVNPSLGAFSPPNMAMDPHGYATSLGMTHFHSFPHTFPTFMKYEQQSFDNDYMVDNRTLHPQELLNQNIVKVFMAILKM